MHFSDDVSFHFLGALLLFTCWANPDGPGWASCCRGVAIVLIFLFMSIKVCLKSRVSCEFSIGAWLRSGLCECTHVSSVGSLPEAVEVIVKTFKGLR